MFLGTNAYVYRAALICEPCAQTILDAGTTRADLLSDSNYVPQGPYAEGGGEADFANHCDKCFEALNNPVIGEVSE